MVRHKIKFKYNGSQDDNAITLVLRKKKIGERKEWLTDWMEEGKRRKELGMPEVYLYEKDTKADKYQDFVNKELVLFSNMDDERSIPCLVDGFKPGQRKVFFTCLKRKIDEFCRKRDEKRRSWISLRPPSKRLCGTARVFGRVG